MTRLEKTRSAGTPPREDRRPLRGMGSTVEDLRNASLPRRGMKSLREDVGELFRCIHSDQAEVTILDCLVSEVLADVNVLRSFPSSNDVVAPFDARVVVFKAS